MASVKNMTSGSPFRILFFFALPLMVGNVFQQLYTMVDSMVVGKALGINALAAVGNGEWLNWLVLSMIQGLAQGFSIRFAQDFGADDTEKLKKSYATSLRLSILCTGAVLCFLSVLYLLHIYRSSLQGLGDTIMPMVSGVAELVMRILTILFLPKLLGNEGLFWAEVLAWAGADIVLLPSFYVEISRSKKRWLRLQQ